jgi:hypothetical protein
MWGRIVLSLYEEDLIMQAHADELASASGLKWTDLLQDAQHTPGLEQAREEADRNVAALDPQTSFGTSEGKSFDCCRPVNLRDLPTNAAERLATFFGSLPGILGLGLKDDDKFKFEPSHNLSTSHPGTIPSLTAIIPAYNEVVIPNAEQLRRGSRPADAANQRNKETNLATDAAQGDGLNTNLGFIISQNYEEWCFLAQRLGYSGDSGPERLYQEFIRERQDPGDGCEPAPRPVRLDQDKEMEVRLWAALRSQTVAKTVIGALQYEKALGVLPRFREHYRNRAESGSPDHAELILAHQTFGSSDGYEENDQAVKFLLQRYSKETFYLVFDYNPKKARRDIKDKVTAFLRAHHGAEASGTPKDDNGRTKEAFFSCKAKWDDETSDIKLLEVLPRRFPLRIGPRGFQTQGKASNQLNGLRFASGHVVQAMDANMGVFISEAYKMPFAMRRFLPLQVKSRSFVQSRYIGFRERIFTGDDGLVGECHANAEWTFGTIFQRFLSGLGARMHYGHPDFVDGFWASNRGGMSKCSAAVNLSEDIFAGFNAKMREETCPHIDYLEFLKGREAALNASSNFFAKISGGSVGMMRSRDLQLICEHIGIINCMSFYFASTAFYVSNLLVDISIYMYVILFVSFTLASQSIGSLDNLGSTLSLEWIVSLGILCGIPQLCELILEYGAGTAICKILPQILNSTIFFMFQNKTIATAVKQGAYSGDAKYLYTGRPLANIHYTWRDNYLCYCHSHFYPAFSLFIVIMMYHLLTGINTQGTLPMVLVIMSACVWLSAPVILTPFPSITLLKQDLMGFWDFITAPVRSDELSAMVGDDISEELPTGSNEQAGNRRKRRRDPLKPEQVRSLQEWAFSRELQDMHSTTWRMKLGTALSSSFLAFVLVLVLPANILDYLLVFLYVFMIRWLIVICALSRNVNNLLSFLTFFIWGLIPLLSWRLIGDRGSSNLVEYVICFIVFVSILNVLRLWVLFAASLRLTCFSKDVVVRFTYVFFPQERHRHSSSDDFVGHQHGVELGSYTYKRDDLLLAWISQLTHMVAAKPQRRLRFREESGFRSWANPVITQC